MSRGFGAGVFVALAGIVLAVVMSWPLVLHLGDSLPESGVGERVGDPYLLAWQIAWEGHALTGNPTDVMDANAFHPVDDSLAFVDPLHGYALAGAIGSGADAALVRYNVLYLSAYALAFAGGFALARALGLPALTSVLVGVAFAYAPWRLDQQGHLHVISSGGIPLALAVLVRGYHTARPIMVATGWLISVWQLSLGFTLGLQFAYLLAALGVIWAIRSRQVGRRAISRPILAASVAGIALFTVVGIAQAVPLLRVTEDHPEATRKIEEVESYSPPVPALLSASHSNLIWGEATEPMRDKLAHPLEQTLFPGIVVLFLALEGFGSPAQSSLLRRGLTAGTIGAVVLALGLKGPFDGALYRFLFEFAPGFDAIRTPGRLMTLATLGLALLAGLGAERVRSALTTRGGNSWSSAVAPVAMILVILLEGARVPRLVSPLPIPPAQAAADDPIVHLPTDEIADRLYMFWSTDGFPRMFNGVGAFPLRSQVEGRRALEGFPNEESLAYLNAIDIRTVIVHLDRMQERDPGWLTDAETRSEELGLSSRRIGGALLYRLEN